MTKDLNNNKEESKEIIFSQTNDLLNKNQDESESINYNFLRPQTFDDFIGQSKVKESISIAVSAAKERKESLDHVLFYGPPGLGKTTLSQIIAKQSFADYTHLGGPTIERAADLVGILTHLKENEILFIDEIHRIPKKVEEYLYTAMEDYRIDFPTGTGSFAQTMNMKLEPFTLIGATTRPGLLSAPLRDRFGLSYHLDFYEYNELTEIVQNSSKILNLQIDEQSALEIAKRSRGTPRIANRLLRRIRDYIQVKNKKKIDLRSINESLEIEGVDSLGLDRLDRSYIKILAENFRGGPVGIEAITASLNEDQLTLIDVVEPFLLKIGFLLRTAQGRKLTNIAYEQIGKSPPMNRQNELI